MRRDIALAVLLLIVGVGVTVAGWAADIGAAGASVAGGTSAGPVVVFLGILALGRAVQASAAPDRASSANCFPSSP